MSKEILFADDTDQYTGCCLALWNNDLEAWANNQNENDSNIRKLFEELKIKCVFDGNNQIPFINRIQLPVLNYEKVINDYFGLNKKTKRLAVNGIKNTFNHRKLSDTDNYLLRKLNGRHFLNSISEQTFLDLIDYCACKYEQFIFQHDINVIVYYETPHTAYDYLFYLVAKFHRVDNISIEMVSPVGRGCSYLNNLNNGEIINIEHHLNSKTLSLNDVISALDSQSSLPYNDEIIKTYQETKRQVKKELLNAIYNNDDQAMGWLNHLKNTLEHYTNISSDTKIPKTSKFGVFFLQVEPESMVTPKAGYYSNQVNAVKDFSIYCRDNNILIFIKEHPHTFYCLYPYSCNQHWQNNEKAWVGRTKEFYDEILYEVPEAKFLPIGTSLTSLLKKGNLEVVSTLNGSVGFQALTHGKNVLAFGNPWYKHHELIIESEVFRTNFSKFKSDAKYLLDTTSFLNGTLDENMRLLHEIAHLYRNKSCAAEV